MQIDDPPMNKAGTAKGASGWRANLLLTITSLLIGLAIAEAAVRLWTGEPVFAWIDFSEKVVECASSFDPYAGWKPTPSRKGVDRQQNPVTILLNGLRSNGGTPPKSDMRILAVGDSYTFGGQVGDAETWPAALERRMAVPVLNGGVCGYGVGQTVMRSQELTPRFMPDILIVGLIPTNIWRAQASRRYSKDKPYFTLENGTPVLRNVPLSPADTRSGITGFINRGLDYMNDYSLLMRLMPNLRSYLEMFLGRTYTEAHQKGLEVSCRLLGQVREMADRYGVEPYLLMQYKYRDIGNRIALNNGASPEPGDRNMEFLVKSVELMECSRSAGISVIDTFTPLEKLYREGGDDAVDALYFNHMNAAGNVFVADYVARQLEHPVQQKR
jgi:hypothetical protein